MSPSKVSYRLSSSNWASRVRASMRKCLSHFGQTFMFSSRSFFQMIWRQFSHFTHKPSVRTFFSPEVSNSPDSRLNQAIKTVVSTLYSVLSSNPMPRKQLGTEYRVLSTSLQYSIPLCAITPFSYACFSCCITVTVSATSTIVGCAFRPVKITCTISGFFFRLSTTFAGSSMP